MFRLGFEGYLFLVGEDGGGSGIVGKGKILIFDIIEGKLEVLRSVYEGS